MNEVLIQYQGFHPTPFTENFLDTKIMELHGQAPRGSTLHAVFRRKNKVLTASIRIMSAAGSFFATAQGLHLREVSRRLSERTRRQLRRWKSLRQRGVRHHFQGEEIGEEDDSNVA